MFCPECLGRFVTDLTVAARIALGFHAAWLQGDVKTAHVHAYNFSLIWGLIVNETEGCCVYDQR